MAKLYKTIMSHSVEETFQIGNKIGSSLCAGDIVAICGELGTGKTQLVKGIASGLGVKDPQRVNSPSFVIVATYAGNVPFYHIDLYRIKSLEECFDIGIDELLGGDGAVAVEWPEIIKPILPISSLQVKMEFVSETERRIFLETENQSFKNLMREL